MEIKNPKHLPEYFENAVKSGTYRPNPDTYSVTQLIGSPLIRTLLIERWDELSENVEDRLWSLHGTALDEFVKKHSRWGLTNIKLRLKTLDGIVVGRPDYYNVLTHILSDLKETSVWNIQQNPNSVVGKRIRLSWTCQLNTYDFMMYKLVPELKIDKLEAHGVGRDWRKNEKLRYNDYPDIPVQVLDIKRWTHDEQEQYIHLQLKDHIMHPNRECTEEEKWNKKDQYAVMQMNRKSAHRVLDTNAEALTWALENKKATNEDGIIKPKKNIYIQKRQGECVKCNSYCSVSSVCPYHNRDK